ncbi:hypothetical protein [Rhodoplanes azumiensis]|uniref:Uncharacterized protein n=1 Tax=Rhodoplanes azumiensis TaxID=1897628 RepID=A0ABW5ANE2_9BRAD
MNGASKPPGKDQVIVYEFSGEPPEGAIDGSIELLGDEDRADFERLRAEQAARGERPRRWRLGGAPPPRSGRKPEPDDPAGEDAPPDCPEVRR